MQSGVKIYLLSVGVSARTGVIGDDNYRLGVIRGDGYIIHNKHHHHEQRVT